MRLSQRDLDQLQRITLDFYRHQDVPAFKRAAIRGVLRLIPARRVLFVDSPLGSVPQGPRAVGVWESSASGVRDLLASSARRRPLACGLVGSSDALDARARHILELAGAELESFDEFFRPAYGPRVLRVAWLDGSTRAALHMAKKPLQPRFTSRDRRILELLLPHFVLGFRNAGRAARVPDGEESPRGLPDLTPREVQIAHLLTLGRTNREIATVLNARIRTVEKHVENILSKLGAPNRTAAAVMFADLEKA